MGCRLAPDGLGIIRPVGASEHRWALVMHAPKHMIFFRADCRKSSLPQCVGVVPLNP
jgi:hypothetical protein